MATTNVNTDADRLKTLQDKGLWDSRAALNLQSKIGGGSNTMTPSVSPTAEKNKAQYEANKATRDAIRESSDQLLAFTDAVTSDVQSIDQGKTTTPLGSLGGQTYEELASAALTSRGQTPSMKIASNTVSSKTDTWSGYSQWNSSSVAWWWTGGTSTPKDSATATQDTTNKVINETTSQYEANKKIDQNQYENQRLAAEAYAMETDTELKRFELEKSKLAAEEDARIKAKAANDAANLQVLQQKEREANEAAVAAAKAKADAQEREMQIANDIELQKSNVAFAKLWLNLSTAAVTQAQQIYTTWIYNLAKLKTENAFKLADLQVSVAKVEFDHTAKINDIINKSAEDSYNIRKKLSDEIHTIKNSITMNRLERQQMIDKAVDDYQEAIYNNQDKVMSSISKANDTLSDQIKSYYETLSVKEKYNSEKIDTLITSGKWYAMTPYAQTQYEKGAGLPTWTVARKINAVIGSKIYTQAQELTWLKWITFNSGTYSLMITEAQNLTQSGVPFETAINQVISKYINESPEYKAALAKAKKDATIKAWGGGDSYWTSQPKEVYVDGKLQVVQFIPWTKWNVWKYVNNDGTPVTWTITDVWENTADKKLSLSESIKAAIAAKKTTK